MYIKEYAKETKTFATSKKIQIKKKILMFCLLIFQVFESVYKCQKILMIKNKYKFMNYNDHFEDQGPVIIQTQGDESTEQTDIREDIQDVAISFRSKPAGKANDKKSGLFAGKQNTFLNVAQDNQNDKEMLNNNSFNGFFKENIQRSRQTQKSIYNSSKNQNSNFYLSPNLNFNKKNGEKLKGVKLISSPGSNNFNSSGKLSNFRFNQIANSKNSINQGSQQGMNYQIHIQVEEFLKKYFPTNYQRQQYHEQYVTMDDFVDILFEEFEEIIGKDNIQNVVDQFSMQLGKIFGGEQIFFEDLFVKTQQNGLLGLIFQVFKKIQSEQKANKQNLYHVRNNKQQTPLMFKQTKAIEQSIKNSRQKQFSRIQSDKSLSDLWNSKSRITQNTKISLDQIFSQNCLSSGYRSHVRNQNVEELKIILTQYVQEMYDQACAKLNKKFSQQTKKLALKYKQTEQLMEKINETVSSHYDVITCQKQYEKKISQLKQKQKMFEKKIQTLEIENRQLKTQKHREKSVSISLSEQLKTLKQKLQKYQDAIFEKAMQNKTKKQQKNETFQEKKVIHQDIPQTNFQVKVDTFTQHRQMTPISSVRTYSPYTPKYSFNSRVEAPKERSQSPINARISFNRAPNPSLCISRVQKVQVGTPVQLGRPVSPMTKLGSSNVCQNNFSNGGNGLNNYSPHGSRILTISPIRNNMK